jgi:cobalamin biosynthesis Mg chelatase CobN
MNIQDTINELGLQEVELPKILGQRVSAVKDLQNKVELATKEVNENGTDENKEKLQEIEEYLEEYYQDAVEQLKSFAKKHKEKQEQETAKVGSENTKKSEVKDEVETKTQQKVATEKQPESVEAEPVKEKSNSGLGALLIGGVILVATLGAVNIMRNR